MHIQILRFLKSRPGQVVIGISDFAPALSDSDDVFAEDPDVLLDAEAFLTGEAPEDALPGPSIFWARAR